MKRICSFIIIILCFAALKSYSQDLCHFTGGIPTDSIGGATEKLPVDMLAYIDDEHLYFFQDEQMSTMPFMVLAILNKDCKEEKDNTTITFRTRLYGKKDSKEVLYPDVVFMFSKKNNVGSYIELIYPNDTERRILTINKKFTPEKYYFKFKQ